MGKVLVPLLTLSTAAALAGLVLVARDGTAGQSAPLNLDKAKLAPSEADPDLLAAVPLAVVVRLPEAGGGDRYVKTNFELQLVHARDRDEVMNRLPQIRDTLITYFLDRTMEEITGSAGMERTKQQVLQRLQRLLPYPLRGIYITDFVVM
jgi:flagellar basal body-associated protein FliL